MFEDLSMCFATVEIIDDIDVAWAEGCLIELLRLPRSIGMCFFGKTKYVAAIACAWLRENVLGCGYFYP